MTIVELIVVDVVQRVGQIVGEIAKRAFRLLLHHQVSYFSWLADRDVADELVVEVSERIVVNILRDDEEKNLIK